MKSREPMKLQNPKRSLELRRKEIVPPSRSRRICVVFFGPGLVLLFIQGLFSVLECFKLRKGLSFESVTTVEWKQKMLKR